MSDQKNEEKSGVIIKGKKITWRTIILVSVCLIVFTFIALNWDAVTIHLIFADLQVRLAVLIFMTFGMGFLAGWLFQVLRKRKQQQIQQHVEVSTAEIEEESVS